MPPSFRNSLHLPDVFHGSQQIQKGYTSCSTHQLCIGIYTHLIKVGL
jgi:hypothetical protein